MKTRILILVALVAFATNNLFSQDIIFMRDGSQIKAKVTEFEDDLIKYKLFNFLDGPTRSVHILNVDRIEYESGRVEYFTPVQTPAKPQVQQENIAKEETEEKTNVPPKPFLIFGRISGQMWHDDGLAEFFGTNLLYGAGIEKQIGNHVKLGANVDFASKTMDDATLKYTQYGGFVKFSWGFFSSSSPVFYSELGIKGLSISDIEPGYSDKGTGVGFSALIGLEIPIGKKVALDLAWDSVFGNITFEGEPINCGSEVFSGGILISF